MNYRRSPPRGATDGSGSPPPTRQSQCRTVALVLNDRAAGLLGAQADDENLADMLRAAGFEIVPVASGTLPQRLECAQVSGADIVAIAGGDGTIACAAQSLSNGGAPLGIIPAGTMNLLAKDLGIPAADPQAAVAILRDGTPRAIDTGDLNGHVFLCAAMFGAPARMGHHREEGRRRGNGIAGWLYFVRASLRSMMRHRPLRLTMTVDDRPPTTIQTPSLTVTVNALNDATAAMFGRTSLDGGVLCVYIVHHRSLFDLVRLAFNTLRGRIAADPSITMVQGETVLIETKSAALRVLIDGEENLLRTPLRATIMPGTLRVIAPRR